ncbi:MAG: adenylate/guanylate cyclase domain-containing protein [Oligoflexia bacterium]|nr:adenylate/guanylate cyclase domain-containing protein [Oligoflexia bacterium]
MSDSLKARKWRGFLLIVALALGLAGYLLRSELLDEIEYRTWDWRVRWVATQGRPASNIKIIMVDQSSLDHMAREEKIYWPWPRALYEAVVRYLTQARAKGVAFDVLFTEPSAYGVDDDKDFSSAMGQSIPVVSAVALRHSEGAVVDQERLSRFKERQIAADRSSHFTSRFLLDPVRDEFEGITLPISELLDNSAAFGNVSARPDSDGVFRHITVGGYYSGAPLLGLPFSLFEAATAGRQDVSWLGEYLDQRGRLAVHFQGSARSYKTYSMAAVIASFQRLQSGAAPLIDLKEFEDSYVFVGMDAPGLLDLRPTPMSEVFPGVEYNATVLDNLLHRDFIKRVSFAFNLSFTALLVCFLSAGCIFRSRVTDHVLAVLVTALIAILCLGLSSQYGYWLACAAPLSAAVLAMLASLAFQFQLEGRQHRFIKDAFRFYVSPSVIDSIVADPAQLSLGGERRELSIYFSDIAGFTSISETMDAQKLVLLLNQFLSAMTDVILQHAGTVDKYVGDAIVAFWNAPINVPDHARRAVQAAIDCQVALANLQAKFKKDFGVGIKMRVGLNTGVVGVGNFGSQARFNYTMIGDAANLASRLEGANKFFGTSILFSASTRAQLGPEFACRKVADLKVVGKSEAVTVYEPLYDSPGKPALDTAKRKQFEEALQAFEAGRLNDAERIFKTLPDDPVSVVYLSRIAREASKQDGVWSPVWVSTEK